MKISKVLASLITVSGVSLTSAECPNSCSGHGTCGAKDMCTCDPNFQGADCSLRTCPFGRAHVDTPLGDLDADNTLSPYNVLKVEGSQMYPFGNSESYPLMVDSAGTALINTAHDYAECSNKGLCDRESGQCECLDGYEGSACQRVMCPSSSVEKFIIDQKQKLAETSKFVGVGGSSGADAETPSVFSGMGYTNIAREYCSGHGTCMTVADLAADDHNNEYGLWDQQSSMGCKCDPGYTGHDCGERICPYGIDPLWIDDTTARVTQTALRIKSTLANDLSGQYAIKFFDAYGEDYITAPLDLSPTGSGHCTDVENALKGLPDNAVPDVLCTLTPINVNEGFEMTLTFIANPGKLRELEIIEKLDGKRSTILAPGGYETAVYTKVMGEFEDHFADKCEGVTLKIVADTATGTDTWESDVRPGSIGYLTGMDAAQIKLLKKCLGDSDGDEDNNVDVTDWDHGFVYEAHDSPAQAFKMIGSFPHAIKVVPKEDMPGYSALSGSQYYLVWYDDTATAGKEFRVANLYENNNDPALAQEMYVFTTKGIVRQLGYDAGSELADNQSATFSTPRIVASFDKYSRKLFLNYDASCKTGSSNNHQCLEKGDKLFILDGCFGKGNSGATSPITTNPFFGGIEPSCNDATEVELSSGNIYTIKKIYSTPPLSALSTTDPTYTADTGSGDPQLMVDTFVIELDANLGWESGYGDPENSDTALDGSTWSDNTGSVILFHFKPNVDSSYEYVSECSGRGSCNKGVCECFLGYSGVSCEYQKAR